MPAVGWLPDVVANAPILSTWGNDIRNRSITPFASTADRDANIPAPIMGMACVISGVLQIYSGAAWVTVTGGQVVQVAIPNATVLVNTELTIATLNIPAKPAPYTLEVAAQFNVYATVTGETVLMRLKVNGVATALLEQRFAGVNMRENAGINTSQLTQIAANTAAVATLTGQGSGATGNFAIGPPQQSYLTGRLTF